MKVNEMDRFPQMLRKHLRQYIKQKVNACSTDRPLSKMHKDAVNLHL